MSAQVMTYSQLSNRLIDYERLPTTLSEEEQKNVLQALVVDAIAIFCLAFAPTFLMTIAVGAFFSPMGLFDFPGEIMWKIGSLLAMVATVLIPAAVGSLLTILYVLLVSSGMRNPVPEYVHWLAFAAMIPAGVSAIVVGLATAAAFVVVVLTLIIWILMIIATIAICLLVIAVLLQL